MIHLTALPHLAKTFFFSQDVQHIRGFGILHHITKTPQKATTEIQNQEVHHSKHISRIFK